MSECRIFLGCEIETTLIWRDIRSCRHGWGCFEKVKKYHNNKSVLISQTYTLQITRLDSRTHDHDNSNRNVPACGAVRRHRAVVVCEPQPWHPEEEGKREGKEKGTAASSKSSIT